MVKFAKRLLIILGFFFIGTIIVSAATDDNTTGDYDFSNYQFIEDAKLDSSLYTSVEDLSTVDVAYYIPITAKDELITENDNFKLYFDEERLVFKVENKHTNYVWSTALESPSASTFTGLLDSGIGFNYIDIEANMYIDTNLGIVDTIHEITREPFTNGLKVDVNIDSYCSSKCQRLYPRYLDGTYTLEQMQNAGFIQLGIGFSFTVSLDENGIVFNMPYESITEAYPDKIRLSSLLLFPGLGATELDQIPGYMVIPDGSGTLIRYEDNTGKTISPFSERFYGRNYGLNDITQSVSTYALSMPIFGAVHGVNQNAMVGLIEKGAENAVLRAYPNGALNFDYNFIFPEFKFREVYRQSFSSDGSTGMKRYVDTYTDDIKVRYNFLDGDEATYVGIGKSYRDYLTEKGELTQLNNPSDINIWLQYLMADSESSFFGPNLVKMSTTDNVKEMYDFLMDSGLQNQKVSLMGWNEGGYSGYLPSQVDFENSLGSNKSFDSLIDHINQANSVMLVNNYVFASSSTKGISYLGDVAKGTDRFKLTADLGDAVHGDLYVLYPEVSKNLAVKEYDDYVNNNVDVMFESIGNNLFSYYDNDYFTRTDALNYYNEIMQKYGDKGNYMYPFAYAIKYTDDFYNVPLYNSQLKYYDDLVPLLEVVFKGSINLYSSFLNYNSIGKEQILTLIDFGVNPSFILSYQASSYLKNTDISRYFTTEYAKWKNTIVEEYNYINDALKYVNSSYIVSREVLEPGFVKVGYSNGIDIYINYTSSDKIIGDLTIPSMDYYVGGDMS